MEKRMIDGHIHIERGEYSLDWIQRFVDRAVETGLTEIRLLEHNFLFPEFAPMYDSVRVHSEFVDAWFRRVGGTKDYAEYLRLIEKLACELEKAGMYADQNSGAFRRCPETGELGMNPELLRALVRHNVRIVTSSDAHRPEDVGYRIKELGEAVAAAGGEKLCN